MIAEITGLSDSETEDDEEFFDAVDAGEVAVAPILPTSPALGKKEFAAPPKYETIDLSSSFKGYENGIRKKLAMDADDRPKISLWVS